MIYSMFRKSLILNFWNRKFFLWLLLLREEDMTLGETEWGVNINSQSVAFRITALAT